MIEKNNTPAYKMEKLKKMENIIKKCRDFYLGSAQIKDLGDPSLYISKLPNETNDAYEKRIGVTSYVNHFAQAVDGLTGIIMLKDPDVSDYEGKLDNFDLEDVDLEGNNFTAFLSEMCTNAIIAGMDFVAVHTKEIEGKKRIYLKRYPAEALQGEQIRDLRYYEGFIKKTEKIFFREVIETPVGEFGVELKERYVVYFPYGGEVWFSKGKGTNNLNLTGHEEIELSEDATWYNHVGDILVSCLSVGKEKSKYEVIPLFYDLVDQSLSLLNLESWEFNKMKFMGTSMLVSTGMTNVYNENTEEEIESSSMVEGQLDDPFEQCVNLPQGATLDIMEAEGKGLQHIQNKRKYADKQADSSSYGLQSMESTGMNTRIESHENVVKLRAISKRVAIKLEGIATFILNSVLKLNEKAIEEGMGVRLDKSFEEIIIGKSNVDVILSLMNTGDLSLETSLSLLVDAGVLPSGFDVKGEVKKVNSSI